MSGCDRDWCWRWRWLLLVVASMRSGFSRAVRCPGINVMVLTPRCVKLTPEDAWEGKGFPPVFEGPSAGSGELGAAGVVYVAWPLRKQMGLFGS